MNNKSKPNKWIAAILGFISAPVGILYAGRWRIAALYLLLGFVLGTLGFVSRNFAEAANYSALFYAFFGGLHAYRIAAVYPIGKNRPTYSKWYGLVALIFLMLALIVLLRAFFVEPFRAPSGSMLPSVQRGSYLLVQKWGYGNYGTYGRKFINVPISSSLERAEVVMFEFPRNRKLIYMKRLIGMPGDTIEYKHKKIFINGKPSELKRDGDYYDDESMSYIPKFIEKIGNATHEVLIEDTERPQAQPDDIQLAKNCVFSGGDFSCKVPENHYFFMGDNRDNSNDSRYWGFVSSDHIVGKVIYIGK
jgi:signal peptidase I